MGASLVNPNSLGGFLEGVELTPVRMSVGLTWYSGRSWFLWKGGAVRRDAWDVSSLVVIVNVGGGSGQLTCEHEHSESVGPGDPVLKGGGFFSADEVGIALCNFLQELGSMVAGYFVGVGDKDFIGDDLGLILEGIVKVTGEVKSVGVCVPSNEEESVVLEIPDRAVEGGVIGHKRSCSPFVAVQVVDVGDGGEVPGVLVGGDGENEAWRAGWAELTDAVEVVEYLGRVVFPEFVKDGREDRVVFKEAGDVALYSSKAGDSLERSVEGDLAHKLIDDSADCTAWKVCVDEARGDEVIQTEAILAEQKWLQRAGGVADVVAASLEESGRGAEREEVARKVITWLVLGFELALVTVGGVVGVGQLEGGKYLVDFGRI
ncbi:hypothetical protein OJ252_599 [Cryptosporidium canis]|uniref:Uncharacterized protein n=1 Tax=Cryptosporidium canis TaxID=195482 RepID=A0ABQ8PBB3_9CRYT|nr:hypothetical protein OJ252_599 [Cryptosporidium canis]